MSTDYPPITQEERLKFARDFADSGFYILGGKPSFKRLLISATMSLGAIAHALVYRLENDFDAD